MKRGSLQAASVKGGKILAVGGFWDGPRPHPDPHPTTGGAVALVEVFDPKTETFTIGNDLVNGPRVSHASAVANGTMWVAGGENDNAETIATVEAVQTQA